MRPSSPLLQLSPEIRLMIYKELIQSSLTNGSDDTFQADSPFYRLTLRGTSYFSLHRNREKPPVKRYTPWALPRVCRLFQRELAPLLKKLESRIVYDFEDFTKNGMGRWAELAGEERVSRMRRWLLHGTWLCTAYDRAYVGEQEVPSEAEEDEVNGVVSEEDDSKSDAESNSASDLRYAMFHPHTTVVDLDVWDRVANNRDELDSHLRPEHQHRYARWVAFVRAIGIRDVEDSFRICAQQDNFCTCAQHCHNDLTEMLKVGLASHVREWWHNASAKASTVLLQEMQFIANYTLLDCRKARKDWRQHLRKRERADHT